MTLQAEITAEAASKIIETAGTFKDVNVQFVVFILLGVCFLCITAAAKFYYDTKAKEDKLSELRADMLGTLRDLNTVLEGVSSNVKELPEIIHKTEGRIQEKIDRLERSIS